MKQTFVNVVRPLLFWLHLAIGVAAGAVILVMSVTGALLAFQPQIIRFIDRDVRTVSVPAGQTPLSPHELLARVAEARPDVHPSSVTVSHEPSDAVSVVADRTTLYVDPYSGHILGSPSTAAPQVFRTIESWHRWLAAPGTWRQSGKSIADASNAVFLVLALTGLVLWWPRTAQWRQFRTVLWFRRSGTAKARDFNWHNVVGFWSAPVLIVLTATGVVMSYPAVNAWLFRVSGGPVASRAEGGRPAGPEGARPGGPDGADGRRRPGGQPAAVAPVPEQIDALVARAALLSSQWDSVTLRWSANAAAPVSVSVAGVSAWNAMARGTASIDPRSGEVTNWQPTGSSNLGQRVRQWVRFAHTGEVYGWPGQLAAALACVGGVVLVWTGLSLALRRLNAARARRTHVHAVQTARAA